jgi:hypothetical protein
MSAVLDRLFFHLFSYLSVTASSRFVMFLCTGVITLLVLDLFRLLRFEIATIEVEGQ